MRPVLRVRARSSATRPAESLDAAKRILLDALEHHPNSAILHYNLACYECQMGELDVAKARVGHAIKLDPGFAMMALDDEDLKPLWEQSETE